MVESIALDQYQNKYGFLDVPSIIKDGKLSEFFPGLLDNVEEIRARDFPNLDSSKRVYLDSSATSQEPFTVIDQMYEYRRSHIRGSDHSENSVEARQVTEKVEEAREKIKNFFKANNYVMGFTGGTTDSSNFIATRFPFRKGDTLIITVMEHNSQILTARNFAKRSGTNIVYLPISSKEGRLDLDCLGKIVSEIKGGKILLNLIHVSNLSGVINPVREIREILGDGGFIYLDMAQSAGHMPIDLDALDVDFASVSSHKMYGPMGIGAVFINNKSERYIRDDVSGGSAVGMISRWFTAAAESHKRFEPGTQDLEGAIEWGFAIDYLNNIGMKNIEAHDRELGQYFIKELKKIDEIRIYGPTEFRERIAIVTFNIGSFLKKNYDEVARELDRYGISVRDGCFCTHIYASQLLGLPRAVNEGRTALMMGGVSKKMSKLPGAVRASFAFYNNLEDAYKAVCAIRKIASK